MVRESMETLARKDDRFLWHPYRQHLTAAPIIPFVKGEGAYLFTANGEAYLDAISSWWVNLHGHAHPHISERIAAQARELEHVIFTDFTHPPAVEYAEQLLQILPKEFCKIFYSDNGSTAVEVALKMAIQKEGKRKKILSFREGYHGETFGAMAAGGKSPFNHPFREYLFDVLSIDPPFFGKEALSLEQLRVVLSHESPLCFIYEPLIQGAGGMRIYSKEGLEEILNMCKQNGITLIADEVMTGFGRTGPFFASSLMKTKPDILCLSKGITGGFLPLGATVCQQHIFDAFLSKQREKMFLHSHSFTANPLACSAALASLELLKASDPLRLRIATCHRSFCEKWKDNPHLKRIESIGTILVLEYLTHESSYYSPLQEKLTEHFLAQRILLRPLGNVLYVMPPYCVSEADLQKIYSAVETTLC